MVFGSFWFRPDKVYPVLNVGRCGKKPTAIKLSLWKWYCELIDLLADA